VQSSDGAADEVIGRFDRSGAGRTGAAKHGLIAGVEALESRLHRLAPGPERLPRPHRSEDLSISLTSAATDPRLQTPLLHSVFSFR
jgi:hypothetical protein